MDTSKEKRDGKIRIKLGSRFIPFAPQITSASLFRFWECFIHWYIWKFRYDRDWNFIVMIIYLFIWFEFVLTDWNSHSWWIAEFNTPNISFQQTSMSWVRSRWEASFKFSISITFNGQSYTIFMGVIWFSSFLPL